MSQASGRFLVVNELGLHARAAAKLVRTAASFTSRIMVGKDGRSADAKSIMGVLLLCGERGSYVDVEAQGDDARDAVDAIGALFAARFGEER